MAQTNLTNTLRTLLKSQQLAVLATLSHNNIPYTNLIAFSQTKKIKELLFGTLRSTTKYQNIEKNNNVSMLFDNRQNTFSDFSKAMAVTAIGTAHEIEKQQYQDLFLAKHPHLDNFIKNKDCALIMISVDKYIIVEKFQGKSMFIP
jgi:general stress protein 26